MSKYNKYNLPPKKIYITEMNKQIEKILKGNNSDRTSLFDNINQIYDRFYWKSGDEEMGINFYIEVIIPNLLLLVEKPDITDHNCFDIIRIYLNSIKERFSNDTDVISMLSPRMLSLMDTL